MSRPTKYKPDYHPQKARELAEQGLIDKQIAEQFGINQDTLYEWKKKHSEFSEAIEEGKQPRKKEIEETAHKVACGYYEYEYDDVKRKKYYKPDSKILALMLYSLFGDKYKIKTENTIIDPIKKEIQDMTPEEREAEIERLMMQRKENND